jgi:hypothetical protein
MQANSNKQLSFVKAYFSFLLLKKRWIFLSAMVGMLLGVSYVLLKPIKYIARSSFVVEDSKSIGGSGILGALSGQFSSEIMSALGGGSNLLSGENILELSKSRSLLRKTFLTSYDGTNRSLADVYAEKLKLKKKWKESRKVGLDIQFDTGNKKFSRIQDSLLNTLIERVIDKDLSIYKPDRRLSLFELNITMRDELLASEFCQRLLSTISEFYINTKTKRLRGNISRLQFLADSLQKNSNSSIKNSAQSSLSLTDISPQYIQENIQNTIDSREEILSTTIYTEVIKNLEITKLSLLQETPTIQLIDNPDTPLEDNKNEWYEGLMGGFGVGFLLSIVVLIFLYEPTIHSKSETVLQ